MNQKNISAFIKSKGIQLEAEDQYLISEFLYNQRMMKAAKKEVKENGILINMSTKPGIESLQKNQAISVYDQCLKNIFDISKKLGLSPADRKALINEQANPKKDGFLE